MLYAVVIVLLVALDQLVKWFTRANIAPGEHLSFIPHVLGLTYVENTGAAFSSFSGATLALGLLSAAVSAVLIYVLAKRKVTHPLGRWIVAVILAGALGNMIDRLFMGYVTDMFEVLFMHFAVFNVADIFVVVGIFAMLIYVLLGWDRLEGKQK